MDFTQQHISLTFVLLLNAVTLVMVFSEFRRVGREFTRMVVVAQLFALIWHLTTVWMTLVGPSLAAMYVSSFSTWVFSLGMLACVWVLRGHSVSKKVLWLFGGLTLGMVVLSVVAALPLHMMLWVGSGLVLLVTPALTVSLKGFALRGALVVIQIAIATCFGIGIGLVVTGNPEAGGTLYLVNALLIPTVAQIYLQHSLRLSTDEMRESESRHRELFESLIDAYYWLDENGHVVNTSPSFKQFGCEPEELVGTHLSKLFEDEAAFEAEFKQAAKHGSANFQANIARADGSRFECQVSLSKVEAPGGAKFTGTIQDVTERNLLEKQFLEVQRRESLGVLASGVAHDFNNILQGIVAHTEFIRDSTLDEGEREASLQSILNGTATASTLCNRLLQYTGKSQISLQPVRISDMLAELAGMLERGTNDKSILLDLEDTDVLVEADETMIRQVMLNLFQNAMDACTEKGRITVRMKVSGDETPHLGNSQAFGVYERDQDYLCIDIEDDGMGMNGSTLSQIFDPFFSTKEKGHGLGLSAVLGVVKRHKGIISVRSTPGEGSQFRLCLPTTVKLQVPLKPVAEKSEPGGELVLAVDDHDLILQTLRQTLEKHGFEVVLAKDGQEALEALQENSHIQLVISDINMPRMDGFALLFAARKFTQLPFILTSGNYDSLDSRIAGDDTVSFIAKPYRRQELLALIGEALHSAQARPKTQSDHQANATRGA